eukprot:2577715-Rhodomonas_salina.2
MAVLSRHALRGADTAYGGNPYRAMCASYAVSGTDMAYDATRRHGRLLWHDPQRRYALLCSAMVLRDVWGPILTGYAPTPSPVLTLSVRTPLVCYAVRGPDVDDAQLSR